MPKLVENEIKEPRSCAKCKSKFWNQPRVYSGKYVSGTLAKRFKPTGRAATRQKIDPEVAVWDKIANDPNKTTSQKLNEILDTLSLEERAAARTQIYLLRMSQMLEELGLK